MDERRVNWGRWGCEDEIGAANLLEPPAVLAALAEPKQGRTFRLGQPFKSEGEPRVFGRDDIVTPPIHLWTRTGLDHLTDPGNGVDTAFATDFIGGSVHGSTTHLDALGHAICDGKIYNGFDAATSSGTGMSRCGIDKAPPIITRGVLLDVAAAKEIEVLAPDYAIDAGDIEATAEHQEVEIQAGDAVLIRTGTYSLFARDRKRYAEGLHGGLGMEGAEMLAERDVVLVGGDNNSVETSGMELPVHRYLLFGHGIYLLEFMFLEALAAAAAYEFLFIAVPLLIAGGSGSPINPIAVI